jgi:hypothetical protein
MGLLLTSEESEAEVFDIVYTGSSKSTIKDSLGLYLGASSLGFLVPEILPTYYEVYSVTHHN